MKARLVSGLGGIGLTLMAVSGVGIGSSRSFAAMPVEASLDSLV